MKSSLCKSNYKHVEFNLTQLEFRNTFNTREKAKQTKVDVWKMSKLYTYLKRFSNIFLINLISLYAIINKTVTMQDVENDYEKNTIGYSACVMCYCKHCCDY